MRDVRGKLAGSGRYGLRSLRRAYYVVIHHSGVEVDSSSEEIARYHVDSLGWPGIGYHYVIRQNGDIECCGDLATIRYNVAGKNPSCVGVCLVGDFSEHHPTPEQIGAAVNLVTVLMPILDPDEDGSVRVVGHCEIATDGTVCPGATWPEWRVAFGRWT